MKEYLPFLIFMVIAIVKFYSNFRKEQEKARQRNPSAPRSEEPSSAKPLPVPVPESIPSAAKPVAEWKSSPEPVVLVEESKDEVRPYEPVYRREYKEPVYEPIRAPRPSTPEKPVTPHRVELTHPEELSDETIQGRRIHQPHHHRFQKSEGEGEEEKPFDFDLHDAVIKEAILNRPQY